MQIIPISRLVNPLEESGYHVTVMQTGVISAYNPYRGICEYIQPTLEAVAEFLEKYKCT